MELRQNLTGGVTEELFPMCSTGQKGRQWTGQGSRTGRKGQRCKNHVLKKKQQRREI